METDNDDGDGTLNAKILIKSTKSWSVNNSAIKRTRHTVVFWLYAFSK